MTDAELRKIMARVERQIQKVARFQIKVEAHLAKIDRLKERRPTKKKSG